MKINIVDRLIILNYFVPAQGSEADILIGQALKKRIELTAEEIDQIKLTSEGNDLKFNSEAKNIEIEFEISKSEKTLITKLYEKLDFEEKLNIEIIKLKKKILE